MSISSRTPEGDPNRCPVCGQVVRLEPSWPPGDAPCPACGSLLWFPGPADLPPALSESPDLEVEPHGELIPAGGSGPIPLVRDRLRLGRRESCDIVVRQPSVSSLHCEFHFQSGRWLIRDLKSTNGIKVNGVRVSEAVLQHGDRITVAKRDFIVSYAPPARRTSSRA